MFGLTTSDEDYKRTADEREAEFQRQYEEAGRTGQFQPGLDWAKSTAFTPTTKEPSMNFSFITDIFNQGKQTSTLFGQAASGILAADMAAREQRMKMGLVVVGGVVVVGGFLAWWAMKK